MTDFVLHHYEISPFSAKIRALLGYCGLDWRSSLVPPMPPRPLVDALAGGYRRIPVAQVGADLFCDSRLIADEVAHLAGRPELTAAGMSPAQRALADHAELEAFFASVSQAAGLGLLRRVVSDYGPLTLVKLLRDRAGVARTMREPSVRPRDTRRVLRRFLDDLQGQLSGDYLFGNEPGIADFSAWHGIWFTTVVGGRDVLGQHPRVQAWAARMAAFDDGTRDGIAPSEVLALARDAEPRPLPAERGEHALLGRAVRISPSDYAQAPVRGELVACGEDRLVLRREGPDVGVVHVHFPRARFEVQPA